MAKQEKNFVFSSSYDRSLVKVLIAGGAGFIGRHLCEHLLFQNCQVFCLDNLSTAKTQDIDFLQKKKNFFFIKHDLNTSLDCFSFPKFDYIFHLAGAENYFLSEKEKEKSLNTLLVNSFGVRNLLDLAKKQKSKFLLVSTPLVFEAEIGADKLSQYFGEEDKKNRYSLAEAKRFAEVLTYEYFKNYQVDARIVRIMDVYGPEMNLEASYEIAQVLRSLVQEEILRIPGNGEKLVYPLYIEDAVYGLFKAMFTANTAGKIFTLAGDKGVSLIEFSQKIKEISGIDFSLEFIEKEEFLLVSLKEIKKSQKNLNWHPKVGLEEGLKKTLSWLLSVKKNFIKEESTEKVIKKPKTSFWNNFFRKKINKQRSILVEKKTEKTKKGKFFIKTSLLKTFFLLFLFLGIILGAPILTLSYYFQKGQKEEKKNNFSEAVVSFQKTQDILNEFNWLIKIPFFPKDKANFLDIIKCKTLLLEIKEKEKIAAENFYELVNILFQKKRGNFAEKIDNIKNNLSFVWQNISFLETEFNKGTLEEEIKIPFFQRITKELLVYKKEISFNKEKTLLLQEGAIVLNKIIGKKDKKNLLIVVQDNFEIRPTGGFIRAIGVISLEKGKILDFQFYPVSWADSQLKGRISPPSSLKKYLGEDQWYFRDANWDPDFPTTSSQLIWFLNKERGIEADGVIGLDFNLLQRILEITGPVNIKVNSEEQRIGANNIFSQLVYYSEIDFKQFSSEEKKEILLVLLNLMIEKIKNFDQEQWLKLLSVLKESLDRKEMAVFFKDSSLMKFFIKNNWDGSVRYLDSPDKNKNGADYLMIVDTNVGLNKTNYFLKKEFYQEVNLLENGKLEENLIVVLENKSSTLGFPGGEYRSYLRFYVPLETEILEIKIGEEENNLFPLEREKVDDFQEHGKKVFGFLVNVPVKEKKVLNIKYRPPFNFFSTTENYSYLFFWQNQLGVKPDVEVFKFNYPSVFKIVKIAPRAKLTENKIIFSPDLEKDDIFLIEIKK